MREYCWELCSFCAVKSCLDLLYILHWHTVIENLSCHHSCTTWVWTWTRVWSQVLHVWWWDIDAKWLLFTGLGLDNSGLRLGFGLGTCWTWYIQVCPSLQVTFAVITSCHGCCKWWLCETILVCYVCSFVPCVLSVLLTMCQSFFHFIFLLPWIVSPAQQSVKGAYQWFVSSSGWSTSMFNFMYGKEAVQFS